MRETTAYIGIGSNSGDRLQHISDSLKKLSEKGVTVVRTASIYETEPVGFVSEDRFLNTVAEIKTVLPAEKLLALLLETENEMGRTRDPEVRYASRMIDLDLLLFGDEIVSTSGLVVPHPEMHRRSFVLVPLQELAEGLLHPVTRQTVRDLTVACIDKNPVFVHDKPLFVNR
jgi:2-amino-4-hydroxy-6-hydroxymethyldihydropteridine diphosphokinase